MALSRNTDPLQGVSRVIHGHKLAQKQVVHFILERPVTFPYYIVIYVVDQQTGDRIAYSDNQGYWQRLPATLPESDNERVFTVKNDNGEFITYDFFVDNKAIVAKNGFGNYSVELWEYDPVDDVDINPQMSATLIITEKSFVI